ncbi:hypothetical protein [Longibacter salinarum]|nr:hypothetical protein [Longibacter salinarum]
MDEGLIPALNARLAEMGDAAHGAEKSLTAACRALGEIQALCEERLEEDASSEQLEGVKKNAARADVSLDAVAQEIQRIGEALERVAGLDE